jgi:hypothetical protein
MRDICKFNKMICCTEQIKCPKCTWNPEYYEKLKETRRAELKAAKEAEESNNEKEMQSL